MQRDQRIAELEERVRELEAGTVRLQAQLDEARRTAKRQAAPFSKKSPKENPKSTARPKGAAYGKHGQRPEPPADQIDEVLDAPLPEHCPHCGGDIAQDDEVNLQFQEDIPVKPIYRVIVIHKGTCRDCGRRVHGRHPLQTSDAVGAAASQIGPNAQAAIVHLNKKSGMSHGKIIDHFRQTYGISLTRSACAQIMLRAGQRLKPAYEEIKQHIRQAEHLTPDETGWREGGHPVWLHGWVAGDGATCFVIDPRRSAEVLQEVIGIGWSGGMTHDGCSSYNKRFADAVHQQCVGHVLQRAHTMTENATGRAQEFPRQVIDLFQDALNVRDQFQAGCLSRQELLGAHEDYNQRLAELSRRSRTNEANDVLAQHLYRHTGEWFMFLVDPSIPATNHLAEQALRVAIVNRKVWGGNRTDAGKEAQEIHSSVIATCTKRGQSVVTFIRQAICGFVGSLFANSVSVPCKD
jgi:transposase